MQRYLFRSIFIAIIGTVASPLFISPASGQAISPAARHRNLPLYRYENDQITITWLELRTAVENEIYERTGVHHHFQTSIYIDGIEKIKNLPARKTSLTLAAPSSAQHAYFVVFKEKKKIWHQSDLILLESDSVQAVDPEAFRDFEHAHPFEIIGQEVLGPLGINAALAQTAVHLGYEKVVYVLRPLAKTNALKSEHDALAKLILKLGERLVVRPLILADGSCTQVDLLERPKEAKNRTSALKPLKRVSAAHFFFKVDAAFNGNAFFWDDMLVALATALHHPWLARSTIDFWLEVQKDFGGVIPREIIKSNLKSLWFESVVEGGEPPRPNLQYTNPYLMHWAADFLYRLNPDQANYELITRVTQSMEQYAHWIEQNRSVNDERSGKFVGFVTNALGSGEDDSRGERGNDHSPLSLRSGWVDLLAQQIDLYKGLAHNYEIMASRERALNRIDNSTLLQSAGRERAKALVSENLLNADYYDTQRKFFYDLTFDGRVYARDTRYSSVAGFWPLFSASVSPSRLQEIIDTQFTPQRFGGEFPVPANALDEVTVVNGKEDAEQDGYWAKWSRWPSMASIVSEGLSRSGRPQVAHEIMIKFLKGMTEASEDFKLARGQDSVFEFYGQSSVIGGDGTPHLRGRRGRHGSYDARENFAGWGKVPPVYSMVVNVLGLEPQADDILNWNVMLNLRKGQSIGLKNFSYQGGNVELLKLTSLGSTDYRVEVSSPQPFKLALTNAALKRGLLISIKAAPAAHAVSIYDVHLAP